jgi:hypothetical protein
VSKGVVREHALTDGRATAPKTQMIDPLSIQELRDSYDGLKKRVDQLGRFL